MRKKPAENDRTAYFQPVLLVGAESIDQTRLWQVLHRINKANWEGADFFGLTNTESTLGIDEVRKFINWSNKKAFNSENKLGIIANTYNACASIGWNEGTSFPIRSGHGCIGCSVEGFWDRGPFYERLPGMQQWGIESNADKVAAVGAAALGAAVSVQMGATVVQRFATKKNEAQGTEENKEDNA